MEVRIFLSISDNHLDFEIMRVSCTKRLILIPFAGVILELSEREIQDFREKFWSKFWISLHIQYIFTSPSAQDREVSQLRETFSPKLPSRMTPAFISGGIQVTE